MFSYITSLLENPKEMLIFFLLAFPGRILAISAHEFAHAWMANRCGDPTARYMGRLTLNPFKHLDPLGTAMMLLLGFGWAKPVPVNPRNYRNFRRDDLLVSIAGVTMNLIMFLIGFLGLGIFIFAALSALPSVANYMTADAQMFVSEYFGTSALFQGNTYFPLKLLFENAPYISEYLITPVFGRLAGYAYDMLGYFVQVNIVLAVFNLLPVPPLDGYHVVNDLLLRRSLFAEERTARAAMGILMVLMFTGVLGDGISFVVDYIVSFIGSALYALGGLIGIV